MTKKPPFLVIVSAGEGPQSILAGLSVVEWVSHQKTFFYEIRFTLDELPGTIDESRFTNHDPAAMGTILSAAFGWLLSRGQLTLIFPLLDTE